MNHTFNVEIAVRYGIEEAVLLENIAYWYLKNKANETNFHDGDYWSYCSVKGFAELFPYMSKDKIQKHLNKLKDAGLIKTNNYNKSLYDKTLWYALTDTAKMLYGESKNAESNKQNCFMEKADLPNRESGNTEPIPDINTDNIPPYNPPASGGSGEDDSENEKRVETIDGDKAFEELCGIYPRANGSEKAKSHYMGFLTNGRKFDGYPVTRLNHWQIFAAVRQFVMDMDKESRETDKMPYFSTLFNADMLGYVKKSQVGYEKAMLKKYGEDWHKIKFKYTFAYPKAVRKRRKDKSNE